MAFSGMRGALSKYNDVRVETGITDASRHRLIALLLDGALERIAIAKGHMSRGETVEKGACISRVITILDGLRASLNKEAGGALAQNLDELYSYMDRCLLRANCENDIRLLDEVSGLLMEIRNAWVAIAQQDSAPVGGTS
ncbi:MAG: flagellar export chaperone FliS [Gammaproteobacteria bacterium]|nr:flagellar export chaperone FliS [Gammaproteobacteria bacterium]